MTDWPSGLPSRWLRSGLSESLADNTIRSQVDRGPAKVRRRTVAKTRTISGQMHMTHAEWDILDDFFLNTVKETLPFNIADPFKDGDVLQVRFTSPPRRSYFAPGAVKVDLSLERMP